ncbi:MAG: peroxiredoxin family protein [Akkermansiaceae bacterium]
MKTFYLTILIAVWCSLWPSAVLAATDAEANEIVTEYQRAQKLWIAEMKLAPNAAAVEVVKEKRPDVTEYSKRLKRLLNRYLDKEWSIKYGAWLLENDIDLTSGSQRALLNAVQKYHIASSEVGVFALAMVYLRQGNDAPKAGQIPLRSQGMKLLEDIKSKNPDPKIQGQAALGLALMLAPLGEDGGVVRQRLSNLREAVKKSAEIKVGDRTVADVVKDQLYIITHLSKGRVAPNLMGGDSAGRPIQLKDYRGKVVMLVFWSSYDAELERMKKALKMLRDLNQSKATEPFAILGVNRDNLVNLRSLEADRIVTWRNISDPEQKIAQAYHITSWPYCMVLDEKGVIQYSGALGSFADSVVAGLLSKKVEPAKP